VSARRGDVWLVDFGEPVGLEQAGLHPTVVVWADGLSEGPAGVVMVVPVTSARRGLPSHIEIDDPDSGLDQVSHAECEDLKSSSDRRLVHRLGAVAAAVMVGIERVLRYLLDL
jgi:mRNA interferase MazF